MYGSVCADEVEQGAHLAAAGRTPRHRSTTRVHQCLQRAGDESIVHEEILMNVEPAVEAFEITCAVIGDAMAQGEILRAGGRTDRIGLHEGQRIEGALKCGGGKEAARDSKSAQLVEGHAWRAIWRR